MVTRSSLQQPRPPAAGNRTDIQTAVQDKARARVHLSNRNEHLKIPESSPVLYSDKDPTSPPDDTEHKQIRYFGCKKHLSASFWNCNRLLHRTEKALMLLRKEAHAALRAPKPLS